MARVRTVHPIEAESYRILRASVDTTHLPPLTRDVAERIVHTTADPEWVGDLVTTEEHLSAGRAALVARRPLVVDVAMVRAGITTFDSICRLPESATDGLTRSAAGIRRAAEEAADGAVWVIGNAPTALYELLRLCATGAVRPALVVGLPVGFVGAAESKAALRASGLPQLSNRSAKGGAAVAAAAVNALLYGNPLEDGDPST
ncbi:precorrin-8X methylmutase [Virgisporangium aliadipatigenens]|uniref:Precorrin-8X methylmutase n=1 Tax=Virgisporangium aliadipatigenens TaxID=741659 RepID=A0A8J4DRZ0_9ACTN|nr:precorrin-8X methylmutase [Virgisporangium aliadipatigenens]GIJ47606.1 precorrin-8X methylmutase [Virgisporangium aliadipatigenens]